MIGVEYPVILALGPLQTTIIDRKVISQAKTRCASWLLMWRSSTKWWEGSPLDLAGDSS